MVSWKALLFWRTNYARYYTFLEYYTIVYQPYIDIVPYFDDTKERKALVLWYNEVTNEGVDKKYKVLLKL